MAIPFTHLLLPYSPTLIVAVSYHFVYRSKCSLQSLGLRCCKDGLCHTCRSNDQHCTTTAVPPLLSELTTNLHTRSLSVQVAVEP